MLGPPPNVAADVVEVKRLLGNEDHIGATRDP